MYLFLQKIDFVTFIFLCLIAVSFFRLLFWGDNKERSFQKIIGGLAVFIVAFSADNPYVFSLSLFIGGLIIASEKFMKALAAIMKADSKDIKDIYNEDFKKATEKEIDEKQNEDKKIEEEVIKRPLGKTNQESGRFDYAKRREIEDQVAEKLSDDFGLDYMRNMKISVGKANLVFDGMLRPSSGYSHLLASKPFAVEIKYVPDLSSNNRYSSLDFIITRAIGNIFSKVRDIRLMFVVVSDDLSTERALSIRHELSQKYPEVKFAIFSYDTKKDEVVDILVPKFLNQ